MTRITDIEGVGKVNGNKLSEIGITTLEKLLEHCATPRGRKDTSDKCGINEKLILGWVNRADLARINGIGSEYADLLEFAGVDTVPELAQRNPQNLYLKIKEVNEEKKLVRALPSEADVDYWIKQAKELPRIVQY